MDWTQPPKEVSDIFIIIIIIIIIVMMMMMMMMMMIIIIIIIIIIIKAYFYSSFPCETCSTALNKCKYKNTKHTHLRHPIQHVSKKSCSNIHLSSKDGYKKRF